MDMVADQAKCTIERRRNEEKAIQQQEHAKMLSREDVQGFQSEMRQDKMKSYK